MRKGNAIIMFAVIMISSFILAILTPRSSFALDPVEFQKAMEAYLESDANVEKMIKSFQSFAQKKQMEAQKDQQKAEEQAMEEQFKNPVKIDIGDSPVKGPAEAKVTIVEYSDFQCPFCKRGAKAMEDILAAYPKDVKVVFKNMPLSFHPQAKSAAKASLAAKEQGKYWEMHDALFENQQALGAEKYLELAQKIGLDVERFKADLERNDAKYEASINADTAGGTKLGVQGTPAFFVNGVLLSGAQPVEKFKKVVNRWLAKK